MLHLGGIISQAEPSLGETAETTHGPQKELSGGVTAETTSSP